MNKQIESQTFKDVFLNVSALYSVLRGTPQQGVRRAELKQGEVIAEAIDFMADVEIKAHRVLSPPYCFVYLRAMITGDYGLFPVNMQCALGEAFLRSDLNYDGAYRVLYYRAKNNLLQDRDEPMHFPEEAVNAEDILNGQSEL
jgi:hypothetical protein